MDNLFATPEYELEITGLVKQQLGLTPDSVKWLPISGGGRRYCRLIFGDKSIIGCASEDTSENKVFLQLASYLRSEKVEVPEILAVNRSQTVYLQSDAGERQLYDFILDNPLDVNRERRVDGRTQRLIHQALEQLALFHALPEKDWKDKVGFPEFNEALIDHDFNYFIENILEVLNIRYDNTALEKDLLKLSKSLLSVSDNLKGLMYRDFQSRNVMVSGSANEHSSEGCKVSLIDFQSARKGPVLYDLASFLWQAKASFPDNFRDQMVDFYLSIASFKDDKLALEEAKEMLPHFVLFRNLQVLGAYGFRGLKEGKRHFIESLPYAVSNLKSLLLNRLSGQYPYIENIAKALVEEYCRETWDFVRV